MHPTYTTVTESDLHIPGSGETSALYNLVPRGRPSPKPEALLKTIVKRDKKAGFENKLRKLQNAFGAFSKFEFLLTSEIERMTNNI